MNYGNSYDMKRTKRTGHMNDDTIVAEDVIGVDFTNDYNDHLIYGTGVVNHFEYDGVGWTWHQLEDNE